MLEGIRQEIRRCECKVVFLQAATATQKAMVLRLGHDSAPSSRLKIWGAGSLFASLAGNIGIRCVDTQPFHEFSESPAAEAVAGAETQVSDVQNPKPILFKSSDPAPLAKSNELRDTITRNAMYPRQQ